MKRIGWILGILMLFLFTFFFDGLSHESNNTHLGNVCFEYENDSMSSSLNIKTDDASREYITVSGIYKVTKGKNYSSISIPRSVFDGYKYLTIKANSKFPTRVHILQEKPSKANEQVLYSDYYQESFLVQKGIKSDIVIPGDAKYIYILNSTEGHHNTPDSITLYADGAWDNGVVEKESSSPNHHILSHKFLHWNIGHFSNGKYPYSTIVKNNYLIKKDGFVNFIQTYCLDCHYLFNEYDDTFAIVNGVSINTISILCNKHNSYKVFPRSTSSGYNKLAVYGKEGLLGYKYGVFESLKGVKNSRGTLEYGAGYCISKYAIGDTSLYVMSLHAPNKIKKHENDALYREILEICSGLDNCILVGDFNRVSVNAFTVLTDAGFKILNDNCVTYPNKGYILDWVLYRCKNVTLSGFRVYSEAVDGNGEFLSDHLPLSFTATYNNKE